MEVLFPGFYTHLFFSPDSACTIEELSAITAKLLAILTVWGVFDAVSLMFSGALRGAGDTKFVVWVSSLSAWFFWIPGVTVYGENTGGAPNHLGEVRTTQLPLSGLSVGFNPSSGRSLSQRFESGEPGGRWILIEMSFSASPDPSHFLYLAV